MKEFTITMIQNFIRSSRIARTTLVLAFMLLGLGGFALYSFGEPALQILTTETRRLDAFILLMFRNANNASVPIGPGWFVEMMRDFSALGSNGILIALTLSVSGYLVLIRKRHAAMLMIGAVFSGMVLSNLLKWAFDRARPELALHISAVYSQSFPSGHAMLSAVVYLTLALMLARTQSQARIKMYLLSIAGLATLIVGISRVYLGVHWPSDVLAGWAIGAAWALLCWLVMRWLQRQGKVETET